MFNSVFTLIDFIQPVSVCRQQEEVQVLLSCFVSSQQSFLIIIDEDEFPLGKIELCRLLPYILQDRSVRPDIANGISLNAWLESIDPIVKLNATTKVQDFVAHLQTEPEFESVKSRVYVLVDSEDKVLGVLDLQRLLQFWLRSCSWRSASQLLENSLAISESEKLSELLELIPVPLRLQTDRGQIIYQNKTWLERIGLTKELKECDTLITLKTEWQKANHSVLLPTTPTSSSDDDRNLNTKIYCNLEDQPITSSIRLPESLELGTGQYATSMENSGATLSIPEFKPTNTENSQYLPEKSTEATNCCPNTYPQWNLSQNEVKNSWEKNNIEQIESSSAQSSLPPRKQIKVEPKWQFLQLPLSKTINRQNSDNSSDKTRSTSINDKSSDLPTIIAESQPITSASAISLAEMFLANSSLSLVVAIETEKLTIDRQLAAKNADLMELNRLKDNFLATLSHELKSPLTAIVGLSSLLKEQKLGTLNQRQGRYAELIYHSGRQLMNLVNDLFDLNRIESGQLQLTLETVEIKSVCEQAFQQVFPASSLISQETSQDRNLTFRSTNSQPQFILTIAKELETAIGDELRLRQILVHLLDNAYKFTPTTGEIGIDVSRWENWIAWTVWDTGIGIAEDSQHLIFQKLHKPETPKSGKFAGTGLGLLLAQKLAQAHGGDISFLSVAGKGSEFSLLIPANSLQFQPNLSVRSSIAKRLACGETELRQDNQDNYVRQDRLVLIVEGVARQVQNLTSELKSLGYHIAIARTGMEAIEKARHLMPAKIILNPFISMLSGWDILTLLKSDPKTKAIPTIITAKYSEKEKARQYGADGFLSIPIKPQLLQEIFPPFQRRSRSASPVARPPDLIKKSLKILHLYVKSKEYRAHLAGDTSEFVSSLNSYLSRLHHHILEADNLEQADLIARIWNLDVILIQGNTLEQPLDYLRSLGEHESLSSLPLVSCDAKLAEAASQVSHLSLFPCLAPANEEGLEKLLEVIQIAAGVV